MLLLLAPPIMINLLGQNQRPTKPDNVEIYGKYSAYLSILVNPSHLALIKTFICPDCGIMGSSYCRGTWHHRLALIKCNSAVNDPLF